MTILQEEHQVLWENIAITRLLNLTNELIQSLSICEHILSQEDAWRNLLHKRSPSKLKTLQMFTTIVLPHSRSNQQLLFLMRKERNWWSSLNILTIYFLCKLTNSWWPRINLMHKKGNSWLRFASLPIQWLIKPRSWWMQRPKSRIRKKRWVQIAKAL